MYLIHCGYALLLVTFSVASEPKTVTETVEHVLSSLVSLNPTERVHAGVI